MRARVCVLTCVHAFMSEYVCVCTRACALDCLHAFMCTYVRARAFWFSYSTKTAPLGQRKIIKIAFFKNIFAIVHAQGFGNVAIIIHLNNYKYLIIV